MRKEYCTGLCPRRIDPRAACDLCAALDDADRCWHYLCGGRVGQVVYSWLKHFWGHITGPTGYRILGGALGLYIAFHAIVEARYERRLNRALYERAAFTDLVSSGNSAAFVTAMKDFGRVQMLPVPPEPSVSNPVTWFVYKDIYPNREPLWRWARSTLAACAIKPIFRPQERPTYTADCTTNDKWRIDLIRANLAGADLHDVDLQRANLHEAQLPGAALADSNLYRAILSEANLIEADLERANLERADLRGAYLRGDFKGEAFEDEAFMTEGSARNWTPEQLQQAYWNTETRWPDGYEPPCPQNLPQTPCEP
jgi:hypothetical protein